MTLFKCTQSMVDKGGGYFVDKFVLNCRALFCRISSQISLTLERFEFEVLRDGLHKYGKEMMRKDFWKWVFGGIPKCDVFCGLFCSFRLLGEIDFWRTNAVMRCKMEI